MEKELKREITIATENVNNLKIIVKEDLIGATELLSRVNKYADTLKKDRLSLTQPLEDSLILIRAKYKPTEEMLKEAVKVIKSKMGAYQTEQLRLQRTEEEKIVKKIESGYITTETAISKMEAVKVVDNKVQASAGTVSFREEKDFEVMDVSMLPVKFLLPNEVEIRKQLKAGIELPGCRYFTKQIITNRKK